MEKANEPKRLGSRISACRQNKNMTQEELAGRLGITPQALSKWERGISFPDISMLAQLTRLLGVSADYLLGIENRENETGGDGESWFMQSELEKYLSGRDPLTLNFGMGLVPCFLSEGSDIMDHKYVDAIGALRMQLAREGLLLPVVRLADHSLLEEREFMVLAFDNVLYSEKLESVDENTVDYMFRKLGECVRQKYYEIIHPDLIKRYVDNWRMKYPALVEGVVPEKIPYSLLAEVARRVLAHGNSITHLPKIIEAMDCALWEEPKLSVSELAERAGKAIEREDNLYVVLGRRREAGKSTGKTSGET